MSGMETPDEDTKADKKESKKQFSMERLRLATERLQLARIRTTLTLIALGFTAYKVFYMRMESGQKPLLDFPNGRDIGIFLISIGFLTLALSTVQHVKSVTRLGMVYKDLPYSVSSVLSYFVLALSLVLFVTVIFRL